MCVRGRSFAASAAGPVPRLTAEAAMKYLHTMARVRDLDASLRFYCEGLGLREVRRTEVPEGKYTLVFLSAPDSPEAEIELTWNWGSQEDYGSARRWRRCPRRGT